MATGLRERVQQGKLRTLRNLLWQKGALDSPTAAGVSRRGLLPPLMPGDGPLYMDQLVFEPPDHDPGKAGGEGFNPTKHNWLRTDNVPVLVLNATTVNTGHAWQFTPTWMGESPWSVHEVADTVPRLEWHGYDADAGWRMPLASAVSASAGVPGVFKPLRIDDFYPDLDVELVDGGVYDNQGVVALLAHNCNVVLVSDAAGQLRLERHSKTGPAGLAAFFGRSMETLMERIRQSAFGDLSARVKSGLLRGLLFVHMKEGLDAEPIRLPFSETPGKPEPSPLTPAGIRRDFQEALADMRTDLNRFTELEARGLMACGYQMAAKAFERQLAHIPELGAEAATGGLAVRAPAARDHRSRQPQRRAPRAARAAASRQRCTVLRAFCSPRRANRTLHGYNFGAFCIIGLLSENCRCAAVRCDPRAVSSRGVILSNCIQKHRLGTPMA